MDFQAHQPRISIAIMSHPKRAQAAEELAGRLGARVVMDPDPGQAPSPLKTSIHAWRAVDPDATHHLLVQDDVLLSEEFLERVRIGVTLFPDAVLAFYANWSSRNAAVIRLAACAGATWVEELGGEYFPTLAVAMPARYIAEYTDLASSYVPMWREDDEAMREFLMVSRIPAYLSVPCLVEHGELESVAGNEWQGVRQAACFFSGPAHAPGYEVLAHSIGRIPWMREGRGLALVRAPQNGRNEAIRLPWTDLLPAYGLDLEDLQTSYARLLGGNPRLQKAEDGLSRVFTFSLWANAFLIGRTIRSGGVSLSPLAASAPAPASPALVAATLRTIASGAIVETGITPPGLATYATETAELTESAYCEGISG